MCIINTIFDEMEYDDEDFLEMEDDFNMFFDNEWEHKTYIVKGTLHLWNETVNVISNNTFTSLKDAITGLGDGYIEVYEKSFGNLKVKVKHHDGTNVFEIRELTDKGIDLYNNNYDGNLFEVKGATKKVAYRKNYF